MNFTLNVIDADFDASSFEVAVIVTEVSSKTFLNATVPLVTFATASSEVDQTTFPFEPSLNLASADNLTVEPAKISVSPSYSISTLVTLTDGATLELVGVSLVC